MTKLNSLTLLLALLLLAPPPTYAGPDERKIPLTPQSEDAGTTVVTTTNAQSSVEILSLSIALSLVLAGNPGLEKFSWELRASEARLIQAQVIPNPTFEFVLEDFAGSGAYNGTDQAQATLLLSQLVELGGKRSARQQVAARARHWTDWAYRIKRVEVLADGANKFFIVAANQEMLRLAQEATRLAKTTLRIIEAHVRAGRSSPLQENNARVALAQLNIQKEHAEHELGAAKVRLAATWGAKEALFSRVDADLYSREPIPSYDALSVRLGASPEIQQRMIEEQTRHAEITLAKANRVPDVTLGLGLRRYEELEDQALVVEMSIPLPIFDRNQGRIQEALALQSKSKSEKLGAEVRQNALLYGLYQELRHADTEMKKSEKEILPFAEKALRLAREGFEQGRFSYLELSDTQRTFMEAKKRYIDAAMEFHQFKLEIERLIGEPLNKRVEQLSKQEQ